MSKPAAVDLAELYVGSRSLIKKVRSTRNTSVLIEHLRRDGEVDAAMKLFIATILEGKVPAKLKTETMLSAVQVRDCYETYRRMLGDRYDYAGREEREDMLHFLKWAKYRGLFEKLCLGDYVFPGRRDGKPLSNMAMLQLLKRMGRVDLTRHGFGGSFRDWTAERTNYQAVWTYGEITAAAKFLTGAYYGLTASQVDASVNPRKRDKGIRRNRCA